ncbi:MAG TPA: S8 family serine peptidase, partial [Pyrinomonadaceae bacterium]|nr:S8 family serine peptidase [Pyrinomonadaceae bacterium]
MSETISLEPTFNHDTPAGRIICPVCGRDSAGGLVAFDSLSQHLQTIVAANAPGGALVSRVCPRCVELFERARVQLAADAVVFEQSGRVLPTPLRLGADERFAGRGVTIAFLDSGFYAHPDLTTPHNRILAYHNIMPDSRSTLETPDPASWHGMMTSVVAAGNGTLSKGFYRSIAPEANVVLVKISTSGRIPEKNI